ncbi:DUF4234 domain-containing protein [Lipingzhangella sp. LS1_29]|uniref:DUF4234 domain-containing protein n=1 Tax=Lipingzhangella rawalii TaxID=2055835 RepID=A0ABU2H6H2_9ACTN|nr:DUF4234 domain-containing protein [Lipingzhangella rawalii]MDS1270229.1 DUF4234 domain-containing protein [Lipingzhangella rawalii]
MTQSSPTSPAPAGPAGIAPAEATKRRHPVGVWLGLTLITLGIYHFVWYYKIHAEMAEFSRSRNHPVAGPMLVLLFLPWTLGIAPLVSYFRTGKRIRTAQETAGLTPTCSAGSGLLLMFLFGAGVAYYQSQLNLIADS